MGRKNIPTPQVPENELNNFKLTRAKIKSMYESDTGTKRAANPTLGGSSSASSLQNLDIDSFDSKFYNLSDMSEQRKISDEAYKLIPIYTTVIDYLSNMFTWDYVYWPRQVKDKANAGDYAENYSLISEIVDGLSIETTYPSVLTNLYVKGAVYLYIIKSTSSKTLTTISLPVKYCRTFAQTQFGTYMYQFDFSYFDSLGLNAEEMELIWGMYPPEFKGQYEAYKADKNLQWQLANPKFAGAILLNDAGFPTKLNILRSILQYQQYLNNELERSEQQLDKIIAHKMPTWEDKLVVGIEEMTELHQSMSKILTRNKHVKLMTTFGDMDVLSIGDDQTKENKTLENAYAAIFDNAGENNGLFSATQKESLLYSLKRDESIVWKYVQELTSIFNIAINNSFNFKGYQCDLNILPITYYNRTEMMNIYKEGATLGVGKLEYIVSTGTKQVDIQAKIDLEDYLKLDQLKPLSTSYTQNDNSKSKDPDAADEVDEEQNSNEDQSDISKDDEQNKGNKEVNVDEDNTK